MRAQLLAASAWLRRVIENSTDEASVPIDQRPTVRLKNMRTRQYRSRLPNSFYMHLDGKTVVLVYSDAFVEHEFDDLSSLDAEVHFLREQGVRQVDILFGLIKIAIIFSLFAIFLNYIV